MVGYLLYDIYVEEVKREREMLRVRILWNEKIRRRLGNNVATTHPFGNINNLIIINEPRIIFFIMFGNLIYRVLTILARSRGG